MKRSLKNAILLIFGIIILGTMVLFLENLREAQSVNRKYDANLLSSSEKHLLDEALWLKRNKGNIIWPNFGDTQIPVLLYNDQYEFLIGISSPQEGWTKVEGSPFNGSPYYKKKSRNPQTFTVQIGNQWVSSLGIRNVANRDSFLSMRDQLPPFIAQLYPYQYATVTPDLHVISILQEQFHAFQAIENSHHFKNAVHSFWFGKDYPYKNPQISKLWNTEGLLLLKALKSSNRDTLKSCIRRFLEIRSIRRNSPDMKREFISLEQNIEWLEGLSKYTGYRFYNLATVRRDKPVFVHYRKENPRFLQDMDQVRGGLGNINGIKRFYLSGAIQAMILDKLGAAWKPAILSNETNLEDLLSKGINQSD